MPPGWLLLWRKDNKWNNFADSNRYGTFIAVTSFLAKLNSYCSSGVQIEKTQFQVSQVGRIMVAAKEILKWREFVAEMLGMQNFEMMGLQTFKMLVLQTVGYCKLLFRCWVCKLLRCLVCKLLKHECWDVFSNMERSWFWTLSADNVIQKTDQNCEENLFPWKSSLQLFTPKLF